MYSSRVADIRRGGDRGAETVRTMGAALGVAVLLVLASLPRLAAEAAGAALAVTGTPTSVDDTLVTHAGGFVADVHTTCTAAWPSMLVVFALCLTRGATTRRSLRTTAVAVFTVWLVNQVRLVGVIWIGVHAPEHFGWVHGALGPAVLLVLCCAVIIAAIGQQRVTLKPGMDGDRQWIAPRL